jgi:predicted transcriptional regulator
MRRERLAVCLVLALALAATPVDAAAPTDGDDDGRMAGVVAAPAGSTASSPTANAPRGRDGVESDARAALYEAVEAAPGIHFARAAARADVETSTARYHVRVLERDELVESDHQLGKKRLYPVSTSEDDRVVHAAVADPTTGDVLDAVEQTEPATVNAVAETLDRSESTVSEQLSRLADAGVVDRERDGNAVVARHDVAVRQRLR